MSRPIERKHQFCSFAGTAHTVNGNTIEETSICCINTDLILSSEDLHHLLHRELLCSKIFMVLIIVVFEYETKSFQTFSFRRMSYNRRFPDNIPLIRKIMLLLRCLSAF